MSTCFLDFFRGLTRKVGIPLCSLAFLILFYSPAFAGVAVLTELTHEYTVQPGDQNSRVIVLHNKDQEPAMVKLLIRDYLFNSEGKTYYLQPGSVQRSNSSWITLEKNRVEIQPGETVTINYKLETPNDPSLLGTYWSIILVEPFVKEVEFSKQDKNINVSIQETVRFGIQIVTSIGNTGEKDIRFGATALKHNDENALVLNVDLENQGERWLRPNVWVNIYKEDGSAVGRFLGLKMRIFPGTSIRQEMNIGRLKAGKYMALVVADGGDEFIVGAEYTLNIE